MGQLLEVRRHSIRRRDGELSQEGVDLARALGPGLGPFARVVTSTVPRAVHTAVAMGFAVDEQIAALGLMGIGAEAEYGSTSSFADAALAMRRSEALRRVGEGQAALWRTLLDGIGYGDALLVISHSGTIELGVAAALRADPDRLARLGRGVGFCDGVRLVYDGASFAEPQMLRARRHSTARGAVPEPG